MSKETIEKQTQLINLEFQILQLKVLASERLMKFYETKEGAEYLVAKHNIELTQATRDALAEEIQKDTPQTNPPAESVV